MKTRLIGVCILLGWSLAAGAGEFPSDNRVQATTQPMELTDFTLTDQDSNAFRFSSLRGSQALVFFGFTHCPSICPAAMFNLKLVAESLRREGGEVPRVVLISVDGARDTPERMKAYLQQFSDQFVGLTGDPIAVRKIAAEFKAVFFKGLPADNTANYLVEHTSQVYLVDVEGRLRAIFTDAPVETVAQAVRAIARPET